MFTNLFRTVILECDEHEWIFQEKLSYMDRVEVLENIFGELH